VQRALVVEIGDTPHVGLTGTAAECQRIAKTGILKYRGKSFAEHTLRIAPPAGAELMQ
jgi:hypothetical protein